MMTTPTSKATSFTSNPLFYVNVKDAESATGFTKMVFSKLNQAEDVYDIQNLKHQWKQQVNIKDMLCNDFLKQKPGVDYYAIEKIGNEPLSERIIGLAKTIGSHFDVNSELKLDLIVAKDKHQNGISRKISGVGEVLLGGITTLAKKASVSKLKIASLYDEFYMQFFEKAGLDLKKIMKPYGSSSDFVILNEEMGKVLSYCTKKYNTDFAA